MPTAKNQLWQCSLPDCHAVVEVLKPCTSFETGPGFGGTEMKLLEEKTADEGKEKHLPVIEKIEGGYKVKLGSVPHPMVAEHLIQWIELHCPGQKLVQRKFLDAGEAPEAVFKVEGEGKVFARGFCNKHGLWKAE